MKQIYLTQRQRITGPRYYVVTKLVNDARHSIGAELTIAEVKALCDYTTLWRVTITAGDKI